LRARRRNQGRSRDRSRSLRCPPRTSTRRCRSYIYAAARDIDARQVVDELKQASAFVTELHALHGDGVKGTKLLQNRIEKAIRQIGQAQGRSRNHDAAEIDDVVADTYQGLW
jgi:hypothetical protein